MKLQHFLFLLFFSFTLIFGYPSKIFGQLPIVDSSISKKDFICETQNLISKLEEKHATLQKLYTQGSSSLAEIDDNQVLLALSRHDLALLVNDRQEIYEQLQNIVEIRNRQLTRQIHLYRRGAINHVETALRRLANARYRLAEVEGRSEEVVYQLKWIVELCERDLWHIRHLWQNDTVSFEHFHHSQDRFFYARYLLARAENRQEDVFKNLYIAVKLHEEDFHRVREGYRQGVLSSFETVPPWINIIKAKWRLAVVEYKPEQVCQLLSRYRTVLEQRLERELGYADSFKIAMIRWELAHIRYRQALATEDVWLAEYEPLAELDY